MDEMERVERGLSSNLNWRWVAIQQRQHSCPQPLRMSDPPGVQPHRANVPVCDCLYLYVQVLKSNSSQFPPSRKDGIFVYKYHSPDNSKPSMPLKMLPQNTWHITSINQATPLGAQRPCVARTKLSLGTRILIEFSQCPRRDSPAEGNQNLHVQLAQLAAVKLRLVLPWQKPRLQPTCVFLGDGVPSDSEWGIQHLTHFRIRYGSGSATDQAYLPRLHPICHVGHVGHVVLWVYHRTPPVGGTLRSPGSQTPQTSCLSLASLKPSAMHPEWKRLYYRL